MATYLHPGVYLEEIPGGAKPIEGVGTSTAAFLGYAVKGPIGEPQLIFKWDDYQEQFGGVRNVETAIAGGQKALGDEMGFSVLSFFQNGGSKAYIVRLAQGAASARAFILHPDVTGSTLSPDDELIEIKALDPGAWANGLQAQLDPKGPTGVDQKYTLAIGRMVEGVFVPIERFNDVSLNPADADYIEGKVNDASTLVRVSVNALNAYLLGTSRSGGSLSEVAAADLNGKQLTVTLDGASSGQTVSFASDEFDVADTLATVAATIETGVRGTVTAESNPRKNFTCVLDGDRLVLTSGTRLAASAAVVTGPGGGTDAAAVLLLGAANGGSEQTGAEAQAALDVGDKSTDDLDGGADGGLPDAGDYRAALSAFVKIRDVNIICLPGQHWDGGAGQAIIEQGISHAESMGNRMVIVDPPPNVELVTENQVAALGLKTSSYAVLYYPWPAVTNPSYHPETNPGASRRLLIPPCGFGAGMWAKTDGRRGVWKAPAGVETSLLGLAGLEFDVGDSEQDQLNPLGVNCLRALPGFGPVIWGSRTLSTKANPEWRYVPVRRTAIMIEQSIYGGIQWAVFEPNDHRLWASLRLNIDSFMNGLFRAGAFQGGKVSDAYFVRCGLGDTMVQGDIDRGQVIVIVGFAPLKPAEFVIVRIQQKVGQE